MFFSYLIHFSHVIVNGILGCRNGTFDRIIWPKANNIRLKLFLACKYKKRSLNLDVGLLQIKLSSGVWALQNPTSDHLLHVMSYKKSMPGIGHGWKHYLRIVKLSGWCRKFIAHLA